MQQILRHLDTAGTCLHMLMSNWSDISNIQSLNLKLMQYYETFISKTHVLLGNRKTFGIKMGAHLNLFKF